MNREIPLRRPKTSQGIPTQVSLPRWQTQIKQLRVRWTERRNNESSRVEGLSPWILSSTQVERHARDNVGPHVGKLIEAVESWWIEGDFRASFVCSQARCRQLNFIDVKSQFDGKALAAAGLCVWRL